MGLNDLVLYKKEAGGTWTTVPTSLGWPEVTLTAKPQAYPINETEVAATAQ